MQIAPPGRGLHLLLVEDEKMIADLVTDLIQRGLPDALVTHVTTLQDALAALRSPTPDIQCVILDLTLSDSTGMSTLLELLKASPSPVVVLTGSTNVETERQVLQLGAHYLSKTDSMTTLSLIQAIREQVQTAHERRALVETVYETPTRLPTAHPWPVMGTSLMQVALGLEDMHGQAKLSSGLLSVLWAQIQQQQDEVRKLATTVLGDPQIPGIHESIRQLTARLQSLEATRTQQAQTEVAVAVAQTQGSWAWRSARMTAVFAALATLIGAALAFLGVYLSKK